MKKDQILTLEEQAKELKISERTLLRWIADYNFPAIKLPNGHYRFRPEITRAWLDGNLKHWKQNDE